MFAIKSRLKDGKIFADMQLPLSLSVHLIVLGREVYGYAHACLQCWVLSLGCHV